MFTMCSRIFTVWDGWPDWLIGCAQPAECFTTLLTTNQIRPRAEIRGNNGWRHWTMHLGISVFFWGSLEPRCLKLGTWQNQILPSGCFPAKKGPNNGKPNRFDDFLVKSCQISLIKTAGLDSIVHCLWLSGYHGPTLRWNYGAQGDSWHDKTWSQNELPSSEVRVDLI